MSHRDHRPILSLDALRTYLMTLTGNEGATHITRSFVMIR